MHEAQSELVKQFEVTEEKATRAESALKDEYAKSLEVANALEQERGKIMGYKHQLFEKQQAMDRERKYLKTT